MICGSAKFSFACTGLLLLVSLRGVRAISNSLNVNTTCPRTTVVNGKAWPTRYWPQCSWSPVPNPMKTGIIEDINLLSINPYSGPLNDVTTYMQPVITAALQEVEDQNFLPGYRINVYFADSMCTAQDATANAVRIMASLPPKHGVYGCSCTGGCLPVNDVVQFYDIFVVSPFCTGTVLSDRGRYPYFVRSSPSSNYPCMVSIYVMKMFGWSRIAVIWDNTPVTVDMGIFIQKLAQVDLSADAYPWTLVFTGMIASPPSNVPTFLNLVRNHDVRVVVLAMFEQNGAYLICQAHNMGMTSPHRIVWVAVSGWWSNNWPIVWQANTATMFAALSPPLPACSPQDMLDSSYGLILVDRAPSFNTTDIHGLSGRKLNDIMAQYMQECSQFADGIGFCQPNNAGYFYDSMWEWAWILKQYLIVGNNPLSSLASTAGKLSVFNAALSADFQGLTGRHRHFGPSNPIRPTLLAPANQIGDRDGTIGIRQQVGLTEQNLLGRWDRINNFSFIGNFVWSPTDLSLTVPCAGSHCNISNGWVPPDRNASCAAGQYYSIVKGVPVTGLPAALTQGCQPCPTGSHSKLGDLSCTQCGQGTYGASLGQTACNLCPQGTYQQYSNQKSCNECIPGYFSNMEKQTACTPCPRGSWNDEFNAATCNNCTLDSQTTSGTQSTSSADCICKDDTWLDKDGNCQSCDNKMGYSCSGGQIILQLGYMSFPAAPDSVYQCFSNPNACPGGAPGTCATGRDSSSIGCSSCVEKYHSTTAGPCMVCQGNDSGGAAGIAMLVIFLLIVLYEFLDRETQGKHQKGALILVVIAAGQLVTVFQQLGILQQISIEWPQPFLSVLDVIKVLNFNIDVLKTDCVARVSPASQFGLRVFMVFALLGCIVLYHTLKLVVHAMVYRKCLAKIASLVKVVGTIIMTFYISIGTNMIAPFRCIASPNGVSTVQDFPGVACDISQQGYKEMIQIAIVAMFVPAGFLAACIWVVAFELPRRLRRADAGFLNMFNFLFFRFRPEASKYSLVLLVRNLSLLLIPLLRSSVAKLFLFAVVLLPSLTLVAFTKPWRLPAANLLEISTLMMVIIIVALGSMLQQGDAASIGEICFGLFIAAMVAVGLIMIWGVVQFLRQRFQKGYKFFICHQKSAAGSYARLLKMKLVTGCGYRVFLDCDDLQDLNKLFGYVTHETETLLVLCTKELLTRKWCVGELTSARLYKIDVILLAMPDFSMPEEDFIENYEQKVPEVADLSLYGMGVEDVQATMRWIRELPCFPAQFPLNTFSLETTLVNIGAISVRRWVSEVATDSKIVILADHRHTESAAAAHVLMFALQPLAVGTQTGLPAVLGLDEKLPVTAEILIPVCSNGFFNRRQVFETLSAAEHKSMKVLPIITEENFRFPTKEVLEEIRQSLAKGFDDDASSIPEVSQVETYINLILQLFTEIAIVFQPQIVSAGELDSKAQHIFDRLQQSKMSVLKISSSSPSKNSESKSLGRSESQSAVQAAIEDVTAESTRPEEWSV